MKTKEIYVEVKKSRNYQTYTAGELLSIESGNIVEELRAAAMARCRKAVMEQIKLDAI